MEVYCEKGAVNTTSFTIFSLNYWISQNNLLTVSAYRNLTIQEYALASQNSEFLQYVELQIIYDKCFRFWGDHGAVNENLQCNVCASTMAPKQTALRWVDLT